jgi:hypothetical protein
LFSFHFFTFFWLKMGRLQGKFRSLIKTENRFMSTGFSKPTTFYNSNLSSNNAISFQISLIHFFHFVLILFLSSFSLGDFCYLGLGHQNGKLQFTFLLWIFIGNKLLFSVMNYGSFLLRKHHFLLQVGVARWDENGFSL